MLAKTAREPLSLPAARRADGAKRAAGLRSGRLLQRVALALNSTLELKEVLRSLAEIVLENTTADRCSLFLLRGRLLEPAVAIGTRPNEDLWEAFRAMGPIDLDSLPLGERPLGSGQALPIEDARASDLVPQTWVKRFSLQSLVLVPLAVAGEPCGLMAVDFERPRAFVDAELRVLEAIASSAGVAVRNARLYEEARTAATDRAVLLKRLEEQLRHLRVLNGLSASLVEGADARGLVDKLNDLLVDHGIQVTAMALRERRLAGRLGGAEPHPEERQAWRSGADFVRLPDGSLSVAMVVGQRRVGALRVEPGRLEPDDLAFVKAIAWGVGEVVSLGALRAEVEEAGRERAMASERELIAADLHDSVGQILVAVGLLSQQMAEQLPADSQWSERARRLAELAGRGKWEIDQAVRALAFVPASRRGLAPALRALVRSFEADSGITVVLDVTGKPVRLATRVERALYRVAHQALSNAWRHSMCTTIRVELAFDREVLLRVVDDGIGLESRSGPGATGFGLGGMRRAIDDVDGAFRIVSGRPRGVIVEARVRREVR